MAAPKRASILTKLHKVLLKHYDPVVPVADRPVLDHLIYACCLENSPYDKADQAFANLKETFFDWNEVRVTTVSELGETLSVLSVPQAAAKQLKRILQISFETHYSFDMEGLKKQNLGQAVKQIEMYGKPSSFVVSYAIQNALSGHSIPVDIYTLQTLVVLGVITQAEMEKKSVPGLERAIPKTKGVEFGSLLHQLSCAFGASPFSNSVRAIMLEIAPDAKERFPKRASKKTIPKTPEKSPAKKETAKKETAKKTPAKKETAKKAAAKASKATTKKTDKKAAKSSEATSKKKATAKKKPTTKQLTRKKPR